MYNTTRRQLQYTFVSETKPLWVDEYRVVFRTGVASWQQWWPFESIETVLDANEQVVLTSNGVLIDYVNGGRRIQLPTPTRRWVHVTLQGVGATTLLHNVIVDEEGYLYFFGYPNLVQQGKHEGAKIELRKLVSTKNARSII